LPLVDNTPRTLILTQAEVAGRMLLLAELQVALAALGVQSVLARNHRLVLRSSRGPCAPSGLTNPHLHIVTPDGSNIATTDGSTYSFASGQVCPANDPEAVATIVRENHGTAEQI
jgi:hypothetical protein